MNPIDFEFHIYLLLITTSIFFGTGLFSPVFYLDFVLDSQNKVTIVITVLTTLLIPLLCLVFRKRNERIDSENGTRLIDKCTRDFKIGFSVVTLIGIISHIGAVVFNHHVQILICLCFLYSSCLTVIWFFVFPRVSACHFNYNNYDNVSRNVNIFHIVYIAIMCFCPTYGSGHWSIRFWCQVGLTINTSTFFTDFWVVMNDGLVLRTFVKSKKQVEESDSEPEEPNENVQRFQELECKICLQQYSETSKKRTPKMLSCGHTLCSQCVKSLLRLSTQDGIFCAFCRKFTFIPGRLMSKIPKNWLAIALVQEIKKMKIVSATSEDKPTSTTNMDHF